MTRSPHFHAIPEITHWSDPHNLSDGGVNRHACYFCRPALYDRMPKGCTLCARCGVFMWTGKEDPHNEAGALCKDCDKALLEEVPS